MLKGKPCKWGKCSFCDYIEDNSTDEDLNDKINFDILSNITGEYGVLEVINSGNVFELSQKTLNYIKEINTGFHTLSIDDKKWVSNNTIF